MEPMPSIGNRTYFENSVSINVFYQMPRDSTYRPFTLIMVKSIKKT